MTAWVESRVRTHLKRQQTRHEQNPCERRSPHGIVVRADRRPELKPEREQPRPEHDDDWQQNAEDPDDPSQGQGGNLYPRLSLIGAAHVHGTSSQAAADDGSIRRPQTWRSKPTSIGVLSPTPAALLVELRDPRPGPKNHHDIARYELEHGARIGRDIAAPLDRHHR